MRKILIALPFLLGASPAFAQQAPLLPPELTDPATAQKLAVTMHALSQAFLNVRVGGVKAAMEGREASPQERNVTVGDLARPTTRTSIVTCSGRWRRSVRSSSAACAR